MFALSDPALIALLATVPVLTTALGAIGLAWLTGKQRATERREDREERLEVANRADKRAAELLANNQKIAVNTHHVASEVAELKVTVGEVKDLGISTHKFLNSDKTEQMQEKLDGYGRERVLMQELVGLKPGNPSAEAVAAIAAIDSKIESLTTAVEERRVQQTISDAEAAKKADER